MQTEFLLRCSTCESEILCERWFNEDKDVEIERDDY